MTTETVEHDWSAYEIADPPTVTMHPEEDALTLVQSEKAEREKALSVYQSRVDLFVPKDERTVQSCGVFVEQCKLAAKQVEEKRTALTAPLNKQLDEINAVYMPVRDTFKAMARTVTERVNKYLADRRRAVELEQQRINKEAKDKQDELDRKAREAREAAEKAAAEGKESEAAKLELRADLLEQKATTVVPVQVELPSKKVELETSTVSFGGAKKVWSLVGWADRKKPLRVIDPALAKLVGDLSKLPDGVRFILQHADLNPIYLNASFKGGMKFPAPFVETDDYSRSRVR